MRVLTRTVLASLLCLCPWTAAGVTIHVPGDRPTIQAGVNAASPGDTVLVSPGTYTENVHVFEPGIVILSESGPEVTCIRGAPGDPPISSVVTFYWPGFDDTSSVLGGFTLRPTEEQAAITCVTSAAISGNLIIGGVDAIYMPGAAELRPRITHNTIVQAAVGMYLASDCHAGLIAHNIVANCSMTGIASLSEPILQCNDVWANSPNYGGFPDPTGLNGNISEDPLFCGPSSGDYRLDACSPCVHGYGCGLIGALGVGCGPTATVPSTWGLVKSVFRLHGGR